jgi:hypothetical protein
MRKNIRRSIAEGAAADTAPFGQTLGATVAADLQAIAGGAAAGVQSLAPAMPSDPTDAAGIPALPLISAPAVPEAPVAPTAPAVPATPGVPAAFPSPAAPSVDA